MYLTPRTKQQMIEYAKNYLKAVELMPTITHCKACEHFNEAKCGHFGAKPPIDFYDKHCDFFAEQIPF